MNSEMEFTLTSTLADDYGKLKVSLTGPPTKYVEMTVTALTTKCSLIVLNKNDFITITVYNEDLDPIDIKVTINDDYGKISSDEIAGLLTGLFKENNLHIEISPDYVERLVFMTEDDSPNKTFNIKDASYNMKLVTGLYNTILPAMSSEDGIYVVQSVGYTLSTPILYLLCNAGAELYQATEEGCSSGRIVMRLNNSYSATFPIIATNGEFTSVISSIDMTALEFKLVDANMHDIKLLTPMNIALHVKGFNIDTGPTIIQTSGIEPST